MTVIQLPRRVKSAVRKTPSIPANANDIETRMQQGFSVFVMNWGDAGFKPIDLGRKAAGR